jgi:hypothetical protein
MGVGGTSEETDKIDKRSYERDFLDTIGGGLISSMDSDALLSILAHGQCESIKKAYSLVNKLCKL